MSSPNSSTLDPRAKRWGLAAKYVAILGVGFVIAPYIWVALGGLLGLIVAGAILGTTWMVLPAVETYAQNMRLSLIKGAAAKDPIGTLQTEYHRRAQALNERQNKIETLSSKTAGFGSKLAQFKREYPADAATYQEIYDKMTMLLKRSREQWIAAESQLKAFDREIVRAKAKWDMALAASDLKQDAGDIEAEFFAKLKVECSFDTIETGMNQAFASLDTLLMQSEAMEINVTPAPAALPAPASTAIPVEVLDSINAPVKTRR